MRKTNPSSPRDAKAFAPIFSMDSCEDAKCTTSVALKPDKFCRIKTIVSSIKRIRKNNPLGLRAYDDYSLKIQ